MGKMRHARLGTFLLLRLLLVPSWISGESTDNNELNQDLDDWEAPQEFRERIPYSKAGYDEENRPIWTSAFGKWDVRAIVEEGEASMKLFEKSARQFTHRIIKSMGDRSTPENPVTGVVLIFDMDGYSIRQFGSVQTVSFILRTTPIVIPVLAAADYGFFVNLNFFAESLIKLARPILGSALDNVDLNGTNRAKWLPKILKRIPRDQLPPYYGGYQNFTAVNYYGYKKM